MTLLAVNWPHVWLVTGLGFIMVVALLIVLIFILKLLGVTISNLVNSSAQKSVAVKEVAIPVQTTTTERTESKEDDLAAIAMALHLYFNGVHDDEPTEITLTKAERKYSPWNSKLYGMNNLHR